jgi:hypothetical protein
MTSAAIQPAIRQDSGFELRVRPEGDTGYSVELYQASAGRGRTDPAEFVCLVRIGGEPLKAIIDQVLVALRRSGNRATDLGRGRRVPFVLDELAAVRLGVLFVAVKPLRKVTRMQAIAEQVARMEPEELFYWFSKMTARTGGDRARRALRVLMAQE